MHYNIALLHKKVTNCVISYRYYITFSVFLSPELNMLIFINNNNNKKQNIYFRFHTKSEMNKPQTERSASVSALIPNFS